MRIIKIIAKLSTVWIFQVRVNDYSPFDPVSCRQACRFVVPGSVQLIQAMGYSVPGSNTLMYYVNDWDWDGWC